MPNNSTCCASCRFYDDHKLNEAVANTDSGLCRFNPPVSQPDPLGHGLWPVVAPDDWCGHFSPQFLHAESRPAQTMRPV